MLCWILELFDIFIFLYAITKKIIMKINVSCNPDADSAVIKGV